MEADVLDCIAREAVRRYAASSAAQALIARKGSAVGDQVSPDSEDD